MDEDRLQQDEFNAKNYKFIVSRAFKFLKEEQEHIEANIVQYREDGDRKEYLNQIFKYKQNFIPDVQIDDSDNFVTQVILQVSDNVSINKIEG